jgi:hypothetical protein
MKTKVASVDPEDILNMDQTPIRFLYDSMRTLEKKGSKTINGCQRKWDDATTHAELVTFPKGEHYACQKKMWWDEEMMNNRIDLGLVPWKNSKASWVAPIIILDAYCAHMMGRIVN